MAQDTIIREGLGLYTGRRSCVTLRARPGPLSLGVGGREYPLFTVAVASTARATTIEAGGVLISTVEHLLAACAGMGLYEGLAIEVQGGEVPLLDGGARAWSDALLELQVPESAPVLEVLSDGEVSVGQSSYRFLRRTNGLEGGKCGRASVIVGVAVDFADPRVGGCASWRGDPVDFRTRIAPARTFAFVHDLAEHQSAPLAAHVAPTSVVIIARDAVFHAGLPFLSDEPARHKLLDLLGDSFLYGGPPRGQLQAYRPGHTANHAAMRLAVSRGILGRR
jgi:UDP-3-O-[3-hydroxymyristoyl] N-acetylglucosamine deacetylase